MVVATRVSLQLKVLHVPTMMLKLLLFAYSIGVTSSRETERRCHVDVAFRWLSANAAPDYRSISRFRRRRLGAIDALFVQVLALCAQAGLVRLGRIALDGTSCGPRRPSTRP
ncbi:MAG: transposase [Acidimicrobiales bacterium]